LRSRSTTLKNVSIETFGRRQVYKTIVSIDTKVSAVSEKMSIQQLRQMEQDAALGVGRHVRLLGVMELASEPYSSAAPSRTKWYSRHRRACSRPE
jgi:hypothetical protein